MYQLRRAVVIGSGTMGAAIAAHLANAGVRVTLLDIVPGELSPKEEKIGLTLSDKKVRNRIADEGLAQALQSRPASFFTPDHADLVKTGNLEDDLEVVGDADWVIEAIIENLKIKQDLMARLDEVRGPHTIITTNTSGIPIASISEGRSLEFRQHFLGTHFFNPPRYLKLLEVIQGEDTLPEVIEFISHVGESRLGKGIVFCKDTPNFIANRVGSVAGAHSLDFILEQGYSVKEVDTICGPVIGRPKTAIFRLLDLVGVDVWQYVSTNLVKAIPHDEEAQRFLNSDRVNVLLRKMLKEGMLGNKSRKGFYETRKINGAKEFWELNLSTLVYEEPSKPRFDSVGKARKLDTLAERLKVLLSAEDRAGDLVRAIVYHGLGYASNMIPEIADTPKPIDDAVRWGFGHEAGPFEIWDLLGVEDSFQKMSDMGYKPASWVKDMCNKGVKTFYRREDGREYVYHPDEGKYVSLDIDRYKIVLSKEKQAGRVIAKNPSATLIDLGDGVAGVEFHTKMNVLDEDIGKMVNEALDKVNSNFEGLVIGNDADNFSAGANLFLVVMNAQAKQWSQIDSMVKNLQDLHMRMRYFQKPVVVAPAGLALGGGAEMMMHASKVVASSELYTGMVEVGAGVIPAGGGTKEMLRRILNPVMRTPNASSLAFMQRMFEQIGLLKVSTSAEEARQLGILNPCDRVVMNRDHLLFQAKQEVLAMAQIGYIPPRPEKIYAAGRDSLTALNVQIYMFREARQITEFESHIANKLSYVLTGGDFSKPVWVDEQYILDLEREAFLSLCGEEKTQQRMWNLLNTGKILRN